MALEPAVALARQVGADALPMFLVLCARPAPRSGPSGCRSSALASTDQGLRVKAALDENTYEPGIRVSAADLATINLKRDDFHGEWNYRVRPRAVGKHHQVFNLLLLGSLSTADHLLVGFRTRLKIRSTRWLKFDSAPTRQGSGPGWRRRTSLRARGP